MRTPPSFALFLSLFRARTHTHTHTHTQAHTLCHSPTHTHAHTHTVIPAGVPYTTNIGFCQTSPYASHYQSLSIMSLFPLYHWPLFISFRHPVLQDHCTRPTVHFASNHHISRFISSNYRSLSIVL